MIFKTLIFQKKNDVGVIQANYSLSDQEKLNCLAEELTELCEEIMWDDTIRGIILTGEEECFSIEIDPKELPLCSGKRSDTKYWSLTEPIAMIGRPVIAAISGDAIGQGLELALACDIRIASETSHFGLPQI